MSARLTRGESRLDRGSPIAAKIVGPHFHGMRRRARWHDGHIAVCGGSDVLFESHDPDARILDHEAYIALEIAADGREVFAIIEDPAAFAAAVIRALEIAGGRELPDRDGSGR